MIRVTIQGLDTTSAFRYTIAGQPVVVQREVAILEKFLEGRASDQFARLLGNHRDIKLLSATNAELRYHNVTPLAGEDHRLRYWRRGRRGQIDIDGVAVCCIDFKDRHIHVLDARDVNGQLNLEVVVGPALVVLLAYLSNYCLHASAVSTSAATVAFIGESGAGKSTLAQDQGVAWRQLSDDVLPLQTQAGERIIELNTDFPQLKLNQACVPQGITEKKSLDLLIRLSPTPTEQIEFTEVGPKESLIQVVRHTVAAKLFSAPMMDKHAGFARKVSLCVPMVELSYPRDWEQLTELRARISDYCAEKLS